MTKKKYGEKCGRVGNTTNDAGEMRNRLADRGEQQMDCFRYDIHTTIFFLNSQLCSVPRCWSGKYTHKWKNPNPFVHLCYTLLRYRRVFVRLGSQIQQIPSVRWPCSDGWLVGSWRRGAELTIDVDRWISSGCGCYLQDHPSWNFWYVFGMKVWLQLVIGITPWIRCPRDLNHLPGMPSNRDVPWSQWLVINVSN